MDPLMGGFSARGEDHPVAGVVPDPQSPADLLLYIHHAVQGLSYRDAEPHVAAYRLPRTSLLDWTRQAQRELDACAST
eukprot:4159661-Prymnesium_polylepis.1